MACWRSPTSARRSTRNQPPAPQAAYLRLSFDRGDTWPEWQLVAPAEGTYYWDQRIAIAPDEGRLAAMFWTHDSRSHSHRDSHLSWGSPDGTEWREPVGTELPGQHTQPLALGGERLLAIYPRRDEEPGIVLSHSRDSGATWLRGEEPMAVPPRWQRRGGLIG